MKIYHLSSPWPSIITIEGKHRRYRTGGKKIAVKCGKMRNLRKFTQNWGKEFLFYAFL